MKKNKMMRLASSLLVAVLLTSSVISGTFAKYVTEDSATDSARVAKWGVTVVAEDGLFAKTYLNTTSDNPGADDADDDTITVKSSEKVVAPGTKNDEGLTFTIKGTPEVDVEFTIEMTGTNYVFVKGTNLPDYTKTGAAPFSIDGVYEPVKFYISVDGNPIMDGGNKKAYTYSELKSYFNDNERDEKFNAGETIDTVYNITWAWDFEVNDKADTLLGNLAVTADPSIEYSTSVDLGLTIRVTQVD